MASGGRKQQDDGGSGSWLLTGLKIGAALGAAALGTYAAVKISQQEEKVKETPMGRRCSVGSDENEKQDYPSLYSPSSQGGEPKPPSGRSTKPKRKPSGSLTDELQEYFNTHVDVPSEKTNRKVIRDLIEDTRQRLSSCLLKNNRRLVKGELTPAAFDKLILKQGEEFKLLLPLAFDPKMWEFIDAADTILDMPGYFCVKRANIDFYTIGSSPWDRFLIGSYLCPELLQNFLKKIIEQVITDEVFDFYCDVKRNAGGVELSIENPVKGFGSIGMIRIKIIPYMTAKKDGEVITVIAQSVTPFQKPASLSAENSNPHENLWLQSLEEKAMHQMESLDLDGGCRWKCLAILEALGSTSQPLKMLSRYQLITILLKACEEETEWDEVMLAERILDLLKAIENHLRDGILKDNFNAKMDLFTPISPVKISESQKWLAHVLESKDRISDLLYN